MRDIKSFAKNKKQAPGAKDGEEELKSKVEELSAKSEGELMSELMNAVNAGKQDGSFSAEALSQFVASVSPMLNDEQKKRLEQLSKKLT